jgi:hypothetical protein
MMKRAFGIASINILALFLMTVSPVWAEPPERAIADLNNQAMEAYNSLDVNRAVSLLEQALSVAQRNGITSGQLVGTTYLNLGIVKVGGAGNKQGGFEDFVRAGCLFPSVQLDPLISTPDIAATFQQAQQSAASGGCAAVGLAPSAPSPVQQPIAPPVQAVVPPPVVQQPVVPQQPVMPMQPVVPVGVPGMLQIIHQPPPPQLSQAPLPLYLEIPNPTGLAKVRVFYQGLGMDNYKVAEMLPYGTGYAYQISCREVWEPRMRYYFVALDGDERILATAGTAQSPFEATIMSSLQAPGPSLPGVSSPGVCLDVECPPGITGDQCKKSLFHGVGEGCESDRDCQPGLSCKDDMCMIPGASGDLAAWRVDDGWTPPEKVGEFPRFFAQLGLSLGLSWLSAGKVTDSGPPGGAYIQETGAFNRSSSWIPDADSYDVTDQPYGSKECPADGTVTRYNERQQPSRYCARVQTAGYVMSPALRVNAGYFILPRLSVAGLFRLQFSHGITTLAGMLFGARAEYMILKPREKGLMLSAFLGASIGQIQVQAPLGAGQSKAPFIISGLAGAHVGATVRYRFHRMIGAFFSPEFDLQFPDSLTNIDITFGPEVAF